MVDDELVAVSPVHGGGRGEPVRADPCPVHVEDVVIFTTGVVAVVRLVRFRPEAEEPARRLASVGVDAGQLTERGSQIQGELEARHHVAARKATRMADDEGDAGQPFVEAAAPSAPGRSRRAGVRGRS